MNVESHLVTSFVSGAWRIMPAERDVKHERGNGCGGKLSSLPRPCFRLGVAGRRG